MTINKTNKLVKNYIKILLECDKNHFSDIGISPECYHYVCESLKKIVNNDLDYLLTDSFLDYSVFHGEYELKQRLNGLNGNKYEVINSLMWYFEYIIEEYLYRIPGYYYTYAKLLDDDMKEAMSYVSGRIKIYDRNMYRDGYSFEDVKHIVGIVFAYYVLNKRQDNIYELCDIFIDDINKTLDGLCINNVNLACNEIDHNLQNIERLIDYVYSKIDNKNNKEIK